MDNIRQTIMDHLKCMNGAPGVQMQAVPPDLTSGEHILETDPDVRVSKEEEEARIEANNEYFAGDNDNDKDGDFLEV